MTKPVDFNTYKRIVKMPLNQFNRWLTEFWKDAYSQGLREGESEFDGDIIIPSDEFEEMLVRVKGIGRKRAEQIMDLIYDYGERKEREYQEMLAKERGDTNEGA